MLSWCAALACNCARRRPQIVTMAPACANARAIAAPIPVPPPVTSACLPVRVPALAISERARPRLGAAGQPIELIAPGIIRRRPGLAAVAELRSGVQCPIWIAEMRPRQANEIGAAGHQDRIDVIRLVDVADRHGRHAGLVADAVGERCLEHTAVNRPRFDRGLSRRHVTNIDAGFLQYAADRDGVARFYAFRS